MSRTITPAHHPEHCGGVIGRVDSCRGGRVAGWVWNPLQPAGHPRVEVVSRGELVVSGTADRFREDLKTAGIGDGYHGFDIALVGRITPGDELTVRVGGTPYIFEGAPFTATGSILQACIDGVEDQVLVGWARHLDGTPGSAHLLVEVGGTDVGELMADRFRKDLRDASLGDGFSGFRFFLPDHIFAGKPATIRLWDPREVRRTEPLAAFSIVTNRLQVAHLDRYIDGAIHGWRVDNGAPLEPAALDLFIDGMFYSRTSEGRPRPDVFRAGRCQADSLPGFAVDIPNLARGHEIELRFAHSGMVVPDPKEVCREASSDEGGPIAFATLVPAIGATEVAVVVAIHNAFEEVRRCASSLLRNTDSRALLLFVDDASTDERMAHLLTALDALPNVRVLRNDENRGYTATVNRGVDEAGDRDVVLLNSDTEVGPGWLRQLMLTAYQSPTVGTVTAISDNAGAFSYPDPGSSCPVPDWLTLEAYALLIRQSHGASYPEMPTGNGFCLYMKREMLRGIGAFDEQAFPRGYGEENDLCMRGSRVGWRHVQDDRTWVHHVRSASFGSAREELAAAGKRLVDERFPDYGALVRAGMESSRRLDANHRIRVLRNAPGPHLLPPRPRILFVVSTQTGGTPQTNGDLMRQIRDRYQPLLLRCRGREMTLTVHDGDVGVNLESHRLLDPVRPGDHRNSEYDAVLARWLADHAVDLIHVRHIAWHSLGLADVARSLRIPIVFSFHDFYMICPTVKLLDHRGQHCAGDCSAPDGADCKVELWGQSDVPPLRGRFVEQWRRNMLRFLAQCDAYVTTSQSAVEQVQKSLPQLDRSLLSLIPHGRTFSPAGGAGRGPLGLPPKYEPLRILFPGNTGVAKGSELIRALHDLDCGRMLEFHFIGNVAPELAEIGVCHGPYQRDEFAALVSEIAPHLIGVLSIWPETYCHTLTEAWAAGVPVLGSCLGAVAARIREHGGGWVVPSLDAECVYKQLQEIKSDAVGFARRLTAVGSWQAGYGRANNAEAMGSKYLDVYDRLRQHSSAAAREFKKLRVGVVVQRDSAGRSPASAHIRVLEWLAHPRVQQEIRMTHLDICSLLGGHGVEDLDLVLVQRDAVPAGMVDPLITWCRERQLPYILEIDDDLLDLPAASPESGHFEAYAGVLGALLRNARLVLTTTETLAEKFSEFNARVRVLPNALSEFTWLHPLPEARSKSAGSSARVLYMGTPHSADLNVVQAAVETLQRRGQMELHVIGGERPQSAAGWYQRIAIPDMKDSYREFVHWFRRTALDYDFALAPLEDSPFNRGKSDLKFLDYAAAGLPALLSDTGPYRDVVESGVDGVLVPNTREGWAAELGARSQDLSWVGEMRAAARSRVVPHRTIGEHAEEYCEILRGATIAPGASS